MGLRHLTKISLVALTLSGCATQSGVLDIDPYYAELDEPNLFVRGTFNWWGANEAFRLQANKADQSWYVDINLIDDGNAYDFKLTNSQWTPNQNCGALDAKIMVSQQTPVRLYCDAQSANLQFLPKGNGQYRFSLTKSAQSVYKLSVQKLR